MSGQTQVSPHGDRQPVIVGALCSEQPSLITEKPRSCSLFKEAFKPKTLYAPLPPPPPRDGTQEAEPFPSNLQLPAEVARHSGKPGDIFSGWFHPGTPRRPGAEVSGPNTRGEPAWTWVPKPRPGLQTMHPPCRFRIPDPQKLGAKYVLFEVTE